MTANLEEAISTGLKSFHNIKELKKSSYWREETFAPSCQPDSGNLHTKFSLLVFEKTFAYKENHGQSTQSCFWFARTP